MEEFSKKTINEALTREGEILVQVSIAYPSLAGNTRGEKRVDRFYARTAKKLLDFARKDLLPLAAEARAKNVEEGRSFSPVSVKADCTATFYAGNCLSLWREYTLSGPEGSDTTRYGDTWDLSSAQPLTLRDILGKGYRKQLLKSEDAKKYGKRPMRKHFNSENFYLNGDTVTVFYQPGTIAPCERGVVSFSLGRPEHALADAGDQSGEGARLPG